MSTRRVLVVGATGRQGGAVAERLLARGHRVTAYVRDPESPKAKALAGAGVELAAGDLRDAERLSAALSKQDAAFGLSVPFTEGGAAAEFEQGRTLVDAAARAGVHLVYSSVRGGDATATTEVEHADSKRRIEAHLRDSPATATVLGPVYFMENLLNFGLTRVNQGVYAHPLSPGKRLDQVTVLDIAAMAVHAIEHPDELAGKRIDLVSDSLSGAELAAALGKVLGRELPYERIPIEMIRRFANDEIATMFEAFEANEDFVDRSALHAAYPELGWHDFTAWAETIDWDRQLAG